MENVSKLRYIRAQDFGVTVANSARGPSMSKVKPKNRERTLSDFYYDDPVEEVSGTRRNFKGVLALILLVVAGGTYLQTTLAANVNLNSGGRVEFGQGVSMVAACSGANSLTVTPNSEFVNASGSGAHYLKTITVSGIPVGCNGDDFQISVYDSTTSTALPIFATNKSVVRIWNDAGTFKLGTGSVSGATITSNSGAFTVSFTSPVALATNVSRITIQSSDHAAFSCAADFICELGDKGPGGGTVFYKNLSGLNCGPNHTSTGSPTGGLCNYLEFAPPTWSGQSADPFGNNTTSASNIASIGVSSANARTLAEMGRGYMYSNAITAVFGTCSSVYTGGRNFSGSACPTGAGMARAYRGGGLSDWYLTNAAELNVACQYARGGQAINPNVACARVGTDAPPGFTGDDHYTSTASSTNLATFYTLHLMVPTSFGANFGQSFNFLVKPIRAF
jgi:hypothetical protein